MRLPTDILHLILSYLNHNNYAGILKFRTICKEWKEVGDFSPVWLSCELTITAPRAFCERIHLNTFMVHIPPYMMIKGIKLDDEITYLSKRWNKITINDISSSLLATITRSQAYEVSSNFLPKYRLCHRAWDRFLSYHSFVQFFHDWEKEYSQLAKKYNLTYILIALLILSSYLISTLPNNPTSLNWNEILALVIILIESMIHLFHEVLGLFSFIFSCITFFDTMNILNPYTFYPYTRNEMIPVVLEASLVCSLVLLICKFSSDNPSFKYTYIAILPFTVITLIIIRLTFKVWRENISLIAKESLWFCICFTFLLVALYYDEPNHAGISSLGYTLLPLIPIDLIMLGYSIHLISELFCLFRDYFNGTALLALQRGRYRYGIPIIALRFYYSVMKTTSMIGVLFVLVYLHYSSFEDSLDLSTSIILVIVFIILFIVCKISGKSLTSSSSEGDLTSQ